MGFLFGTVLSVIFTMSSFSLASNASHNVSVTETLGLRSFKNLTGRFEQVKLLKELSVEIKTQGRFEVQREGAVTSIFHWNVEKPKPSRVCLNKSGVVMDDHSGAPKKISFSEMGPQSGQQIQTLLKLMSSDLKQLAEEFEVQELPLTEKKPAESAVPQTRRNLSGDGISFLLRPLKPDSVFFQKAEIHVDKRGLVDRLSLTEKSQDRLKIQFSELKPDQNIKIKSCEL